MSRSLRGVPSTRSESPTKVVVGWSASSTATCDDDLIIVEQDNLEALSRGTDFSPDEAWADAVAAMGPNRARMFSSDADVEPVPGLGFGLGID